MRVSAVCTRLSIYRPKMNTLQATIHCVLRYPPIGQKHGKLAKDGMTTHVPGNHSRRGVLHKSDPLLTR